MYDNYFTAKYVHTHTCTHAHTCIYIHTHVVSAPLIVAIVVCLLYAPLFACVNPPRVPLLGHLLGLVYLSIMWGGTSIYFLANYNNYIYSAVYQGIALGYYFEKCDGDTHSDAVCSQNLIVMVLFHYVGHKWCINVVYFILHMLPLHFVLHVVYAHVYMCVHTLTHFCWQLVWADAISNLPIFVFLLALLGWFICRVIIDIANLSDSASVGLALDYNMYVF